MGLDDETRRLRRENARLSRQLNLVIGSGAYQIQVILVSASLFFVRASRRLCNRFKLWFFFQKYRHQAGTLSKSKLFQPEWYIRQANTLGIEIKGDPAYHYLTVGWQRNLSPSPFFDSSYVREQLGKKWHSDCPLVLYLQLWKQYKLNPSVLFDTEYYLEQIGFECAQADPLSEYLSQPASEEQSPSPLFDVEFYKKRYGSTKDLTCWQSFMLEGRFKLKQPNPFFVPQHYREQLLKAGFRAPSDAYELMKSFLETDSEVGRFGPHPSFDLPYYDGLRKNSEGRNQNGLLHFLKFGRNKGLIPNKSNHQSINATLLDESLKMKYVLSAYCHLLSPATWLFLQKIKNTREKLIIFCGHEASLTGAPMVLLEILRQMKLRGLNCLLTLQRSGPLLEQYKELACVEVTGEDFSDTGAFNGLLFALKEYLEDGQLLSAMVNTLECAEEMSLLHAHSIKTNCFWHEFPDSYNPEYLQKVFASSDTLVFSSEYVRDRTKLFGLPAHSRTVVKPQGLAPQVQIESLSFLRKSIREELGVSQQAFLVLSCGTLDLRKGLDLMPLIAKQVIDSTAKDQREIHFVWIGDGPREKHTVYYYSCWDISQSMLQDRVHILEAKQDGLEKWFVASDLFLLCSRQDPLPCVAQMAMDNGLPIVAFDQAGGISEVLRQSNGGTVVPYLNINAAATAVLDYFWTIDAGSAKGKAGQDFAKENFDSDKYASFVYQLLAESC